MKKFSLLLLFSAFIFSCKDSAKPEEKLPVKNALFETEFSDYRELEVLKDYEKEIDTLIYMDVEQDSYRLLNLKKDDSYLVLFYKFAGRDDQRISQRSYRALDTIMVNKLEENERVTVGYCYHEDYYEGEILALVKGTGTTEIMEVVKAWRANPELEEIELVEDHEGLECINEYFEEDNASLPIEEIS